MGFIKLSLQNIFTDFVRKVSKAKKLFYATGYFLPETTSHKALFLKKVENSFRRRG